MKFSTTLLAGALLACVLSFNAQARSGFEPSTAIFYPVQYNGQDKTYSYSEGITFELGANYALNDIIDFTLSAAILDTSFVQQSLSGTDGTNSIALGLLSTEELEGELRMRYRVTSVSGSTIGLSLAVQPDVNNAHPDRWELNFETMTDDLLTLRFSAQTNNGQELDADARNIVPIFATYNPLESHRTFGDSLDAEIDLETGRTRFVETNDPATTRLRKLQLRAAGNGPQSRFGAIRDEFGQDIAVASASLTEDFIAEYTVVGNFEWMFDAEGNFREGAASVTATTGMNTDLAISDLEFSEASIRFNANYSDGAVNDSFFINFDLAGNDNIIPEQTFTLKADYRIEFPGGEGLHASEEVIGKWTLNAPTVSISYMPFRGPDISQVINVTNTGSWAADVYVIARTEAGEEINLGHTVTVPAGSVQAIAGDIVDALIAHDDFTADVRPGVGDSDIVRLSLDLMVAGQKANIHVYSAYNVDGTGARLVINDSNGGAGSK